jgi:N-acetylglucosaminyl-diphospho-decaprenol L-rhamnosyltransferase
MKTTRYQIVIPVLNQLRYTQMCVESLQREGVPPGAMTVIDNASTDDTPQWLAQHPELGQLRNRVNLGCGGAWAQGALQSLDAEWVVLLNNDVLAGPNAIGAMLDAAEREGLRVVSPALLEGEDNYGFAGFAPGYLERMRGTVRRGWFHGVCFAVHRSVFEQVGFPDTERQLGGHEDKEFLFRCVAAGIPVGTVGDAVFHHFGSITQKAMKQESKVRHLGDRHLFYRKVGLSWWGRKRHKWQERRRVAEWRQAEHARAGTTLHMLRVGDGWQEH